MKRVIVLLLLGFQIYSRAQTGTVEIPSSVSVLGAPYIAMYTEQAAILGKVEADIAAIRTPFSSIESLVSFSCSKWNEYSRQQCQVNQQAVSDHMRTIGLAGNNYADCIAGTRLSDELKAILLAINSAIRNFEVETDLNSLLYNYASNLSSYNLTSDDKERLKMYIVAMNFNQHVIMNSKAIKRTGWQANGDTPNRSIWGSIKAAVRCAIGTVGGALVGGLGGAAVGTIALPLVGTLSGSAVGFWGGAMTGASQSCF